jgi:hypothetical protein
VLCPNFAHHAAAAAAAAAAHCESNVPSVIHAFAVKKGFCGKEKQIFPTPQYFFGDAQELMLERERNK